MKIKPWQKEVVDKIAAMEEPIRILLPVNNYSKKQKETLNVK